MSAPEQYLNVRAWLSGCKRPLVVTHRRPDGDALGSIVGLTRVLGALGLAPQPVLYEVLPQRYQLLADMVPWRRWDLEREELTASCDALIIVDTCAYAQLEPLREYLQHAPRVLVIDHHPTRDELGLRANDLRLIDEDAGAVCLLIGELAQALSVPMDPPLGTALLVGLGTDTGWFRFPNTDARLLRMAAAAVEAGAPPNPVYRYIYEQDAPERLRLIGRMLQNMELLAEGRLVVLKLRRSDFAAVGADGAVTEDLVNEVGRLAGLEASLLFMEEPDGTVRVNFRSKQALDVAALAQEFGGGGHARAAGARPTGAFDDVVQTVTARTLAELAPDGQIAGERSR
jgi:phosphoesterase RecJ-like protein